MNRYLLILVLPFIFSCSKNDGRAPEDIDAFELSKNPDFSSDCLIGEEAENINGGTCTDSNIDTALHCGLISIEGRNTLSDECKEWIKLYCLDINSKIYFNDNNDNETSFEILDKGYYVSFTYGSRECPDDVNKRLLVCVENESAYVNLHSNLFNKTFSLKVGGNYKLEQDQITDSHCQVDLYTHLGSVSIKHFGFIPRVVSSSDMFFEEIEIHGRIFYEVFTFEDNSNPDAIKFFYNKEFGIVSFMDNNGTQWVLND